MKKIFLLLIIFNLQLSFVHSAWADKTVIVTSDWHISDIRSYDSNCYYAWCSKNLQRITKFLSNLYEDNNSWDVLVLNGDIFEFWRSPTDKYMVADSEGNILTDVQYLLKIKENNLEIFMYLEALREKGKEIVYLPGNHDLTVSKEDVEAAFPGLFTLYYDTPGTGIYEPFGTDTSVTIEHGNRYEYFNAPYQHGVFGSVGTENSSLLAPGYFTSKLGASATVFESSQAKSNLITNKDLLGNSTSEEENDETNRSYVASFWNAVRAGVGAPSFDINIRIDGVGSETDNVAHWKDYAVTETNNPRLFKDSWTVSNWKRRCELNNVPVYIPLSTSLLSAAFHATFDELSFTERLQNPNLATLICVWGHSHTEIMQTRHDPVKGDVIYLNEGAWGDGTGCSYGVIRYNALLHQYTVEIRKLDDKNNDSLFDSRYLYVPENNTSRLSDGTLQFNAKAVLVNPEAMGINSMLSPTSTQRDGTYNLNGQRLSSPKKGINIINGKKYVINDDAFKIND